MRTCKKCHQPIPACRIICACASRRMAATKRLLRGQRPPAEAEADERIRELAARAEKGLDLFGDGGRA